MAHDHEHGHGPKHGHGHGHEHGHGHGDNPGEHIHDEYAEMLDLDAEVLHEYHTGLMTWLHELAGEPRRIVDVGSGTGTGTLALARRFPGAEVTALDVSEDLQARLARQAHAAGLGDRVRPVRADLDAGWPDLSPSGLSPSDPFDLAWASASMHHMADPDRVLADVLGALRPGGLFAIVEMSGFPRFLPAELGTGRPGLEDRLHALLSAQRAQDMPHLGDDWGPALVKAGFTVETERHFPIVLDAPLPAAAGRYALIALRRVRVGLADRIAADDLVTLDALLTDGPGSLLTRQDLTVRAERTVWIARRP